MRNARATLDSLWRLLGPDRRTLAAALTAIALATLAQATVPLLIGRIVDAHIVTRRLDDLGVSCALMLGVLAAGAFFIWLQGRLLATLAQCLVERMRNALADRFQRVALDVLDTHVRGDLASRASNDTDIIATTLNQSLGQLFAGVLLLASGLGFMLAMSGALTLATLAVFTVMTAAVRPLANRTRDRFAKQQATLGIMNAHAQEVILGQSIVRLFKAQARNSELFGDVNRRYAAHGLAAQIIAGMVGPTMNAFNNLGYALLAAVGGWLALHDLATVGVVVAFLSYSRQLERPVNEVANQFNTLQSALASTERVLEVLRMPLPTPCQSGTTPHALLGDLRFENVSFGYRADQPVLKSINLHAAPGKTVALVGATGSGKSTIVNLLLRFYDPDAGRITIDGADLSTVDLAWLRAHMGVVLQDTRLLPDTLRENIRYARPNASNEDVVRATRAVGAHDFIEQLAQGYDTLVVAGATPLSQGQRQLIAIARALLADPVILVLDEATSNIDMRTERQIQRALRTLLTGRTCIVIAHRLNTIRTADRIIVLHEGQIVESGTHDQLVAARGHYARMHARHG